MSLSNFLQLAFAPIILAFVFMSPPIVVALVLIRRRKTYQAVAEEPFTSLPLRPPGESLRLKIEELSSKLDEEVLVICFSGLAALVLLLIAPAGHRLAVGFAGLIIVTVCSVWRGRRLFTTARELWDYRLGFMGERVVGEELNQLLASSFRVFHDVPFDGFNIDHVVVGPPGVYVVETKARRKPTNVEGKDRVRIVFDGEALHFATGIERKAVDQVRLNAKTMAEWLTSATGEPVRAKGILTFPGWYIEKNHFTDVRVMNPELIKFSLTNPPRRSLSDEQINRIAHQLTEKCRIQKAA